MTYRIDGRELYNSDEYIVKSYDEKNLVLMAEGNDHNNDVIIDIKLTNPFKPAFALTAHKLY